MTRAPRLAGSLIVPIGLLWLLLAGCGGGCCDGPVGEGPPVDEQAPSFLLEDVNDTSATFGQVLSPRAYLGRVSAWYFGQATWSHCSAQFGRLDELHAELAGEGHALGVELLGVNLSGLESGNADFCNGRDIPWLQDVPAVDAWTSWGVTLRDVVILDDQNRVVGSYNLTTHSLLEPANYAELKALLVAAANP